MAWNTPAEARDIWRDAKALSDETLTLYLEAAHSACLAYAPALDPEDTETITPDEGEPYEVQVIPESYRLAEIFQARNLYNSVKAAPSGDFDGSSYGLSAFPLDWQVKQLLRPRRAVPVVA